MDRINLQIVTDRLLDARRQLQTARLDFAQAEEAYRIAEKAFLDGAGAVEPESVTPQNRPEWPDKVIVGDLVILAADEWWDMKAGTRLEFHTVTRIGTP